MTSFTGWFGGVNTAQAKRALEEIRNLAKGESETFNVVDLDMPAQPLFVDEDHVGQALGALAQLDDEELRRLLPTHGFPIDCIDRLRNDDRPGLIAARRQACLDCSKQRRSELEHDLDESQRPAVDGRPSRHSYLVLARRPSL